MSYTSIRPENGVEITNLLQIGDIESPKLLSQSAQRLGAAQPVFYQTGQRADRSQLELRKVQTSAQLAIDDREALRFCQGRKASITDHLGKVWNQVFIHSVTCSVKKGASSWLVDCKMEVEALPESTQNGI